MSYVKSFTKKTNSVGNLDGLPTMIPTSSTKKQSCSPVRSFKGAEWSRILSKSERALTTKIQRSKDPNYYLY